MGTSAAADDSTVSTGWAYGTICTRITLRPSRTRHPRVTLWTDSAVRAVRTRYTLRANRTICSCRSVITGDALLALNASRALHTGAALRSLNPAAVHPVGSRFIPDVGLSRLGVVVPIAENPKIALDVAGSRQLGDRSNFAFKSNA